MEEIYINNHNINNDRLVLRPFPQGIINDETRLQLWTKYRRDMISRAGISIFIFGNKIDKHGNIINADGVISEFEIAKEYGNIIVPVGCTGFVASEIWNKINEDFDFYYQHQNDLLREKFNKLNLLVNDKNDLIKIIIDFIEEAKKSMVK